MSRNPVTETSTSPPISQVCNTAGLMGPSMPLTALEHFPKGEWKPVCSHLYPEAASETVSVLFLTLLMGFLCGLSEFTGL